jgi:hypothetical protein
MGDRMIVVTLAVLLAVSAASVAPGPVAGAAAADSTSPPGPAPARDPAMPRDGAASLLVHSGSRGEIHVPLPRVERGPVVDGDLGDDVWRRAAVLDSFTHWEPVEGVPDSLGTVCYVLYDDRCLYAGFRCPDDPRRIRAPITAREAMWDGDWVGIDVDSYDDRRRSYFFCASPEGIQGDGVFTDGGDPDDIPDFPFRSEARRTAAGYEVEIAVPFRSLRFPARDPLAFGFNAARYMGRNGGFLWWAPLTRDRSSQLTQYGRLEGIAGIRPGRNVEVNATLTGTRTAELDGGALRGRPARSRGGLGLKYGLTTSLTADVAITPDFSQIEADAGVVDINRRFEISYDERRPFFLEGADIFATPIEAVYTRRIADPLYGVKLTGKAAGTTVGVLHVLDRSDGEPIATLPDRANPYLGREAAYSIVRLRREVAEGVSLGFLGGSREWDDAYNRGAGLDARIAAGRYAGEFQVLGSWSRAADLRRALAQLTPAESAAVEPALRERDGRRGEGTAWRARFERESRGLEAGVLVQDFSPRFAADMGYIPRTDQITTEAWLEPRRFGSPGSWYHLIEPSLRYTRSHEHGDTRLVGRRTDDELALEVEATLPNNRGFGAGHYRAYTFHDGRAFAAQARVALWGWHEQYEAVQAGGTVSYGDAVIFEESQPGRSWSTELWTELQPHPQVHARLSLLGESIRRAGDGSRYADSAIPRLRVTYQHNRELGFRGTAELVAERAFGTAGAPVETDRRLTLDLLATYLLRPGTVAYLGYGSASSGGALGRVRPERNSLFFKLSYLWQV